MADPFSMAPTLFDVDRTPRGGAPLSAQRYGAPTPPIPNDPRYADFRRSDNIDDRRDESMWSKYGPRPPVSMTEFLTMLANPMTSYDKLFPEAEPDPSTAGLAMDAGLNDIGTEPLATMNQPIQRMPMPLLGDFSPFPVPPVGGYNPNHRGIFPVPPVPPVISNDQPMPSYSRTTGSRR